MDALGINWQYILIQIVNFIILLGFSGIFLIAVVFVLRAQRPAFLSKHVSDLTATSDGLCFQMNTLSDLINMSYGNLGKQ